MRRRLHGFLEAYGEPDVTAVLDLIVGQLERSLAIIGGLKPTSVQRLEGHDLAYRMDIAWLQATRSSLV